LVVESLAVMSPELESWGFAEGDEIAPRRRAVSLLGGGYRYEAWLAWDERIRSLVVAKVVRPDQTEDAVARRTLAREADMLDRLAHPLLVRSFGSDPDGPRPHLVLEFVEGPRLSTLIRRFGLILEQAVPLALNLCSVLHYLAEEGVVHLDVKPRNIIMAGSPRLIDLSVARGVDELDSLGGPIGTDAYMAPEQCDPALFDRLGAPADVWGLGATLYHAVAGKLPFRRPRSREDDSPLEDRYPQLEDEPRPWRRPVPQALSHAILSCLRKDPAERPTAAELAMMLQPLVAELPARLVLGRRGPARLG
jgi:eukaryotic-like serine/threonine-protein kinase